MQQDQPSQENANTASAPEAKTDAQEVKQQIQKDVSEGQGAMTSREAGAMRD